MLYNCYYIIFLFDRVENLLKTYYETQNSNDINIQKEKECDLVSLRIAQLLEDKSFGFSPITFKNIYSIAINNGGNNTTRIQSDCNAYNMSISQFTIYLVGDTSRYISIGI